MAEPSLRLADMEAAREAADRLFAATASRLKQLLSDQAEILHIGATAIPGCLTKGDLDIVVRVAPDDFAAADQALSAHYARNSGSVRTGGFSAFEQPGSSPPLGIQLTALGGEYDVFHLFAERMREDPDLVVRYNALKRRFDGQPMEAYREAKSYFIRAVLGWGGGSIPRFTAHGGLSPVDGLRRARYRARSILLSGFCCAESRRMDRRDTRFGNDIWRIRNRQRRPSGSCTSGPP
ncbi:hypothetical protein A7A08_02737 [Methyloligella halotolerans]|uniref:Dephospho-CoA kinase/protein folding accessory domain-containing protein n=1 Tax=Methyloligella halotolerans TaxID=1177755 RepID=A0A1E2RWA1_9HYPH|nr:GrpB family protein [Methyloligella halotolerans]ODA66339.1 hypothetical protein A7A08_02737 [Methyloligella halotolerans]